MLNFDYFCNMQKRDYIGTGLKYPIQLKQGKGALTSDVDLIEQSMIIILNTPLGTRLMLPSFGSRIKELMYENNDDVLKDLLNLFIFEALDKWEGRAKVVSIDFDGEDTKINCSIEYRVLNSNEVKSFIYPFYRKIKY